MERAPDQGLVDVDQLSRELEFILVDKAKVGSDILHRINNARSRGGIMMYAEVYRRFTETSGLGLVEQTAQLMNPKQAAKEEDIAEAIESWEDRSNRLARHGADYMFSFAVTSSENRHSPCHLPLGCEVPYTARAVCFVCLG